MRTVQFSAFGPPSVLEIADRPAPEPRAGRPFGGTDQGIRAVYGYLKQRYS